MRREKVSRVVFATTLVFILFASTISPLQSRKASESEQTLIEANIASQDFVSPLIYHDETIDNDLNGIQDSLEVLISQNMANASEILPVVVTLRNPVSSNDLDYFTVLGGHVTYVYHFVTYGFAGNIPLGNIPKFAELEKENLAIVEYDTALQYHLDFSVPQIRARPVVWDTYGFRGSSNHAIAIIDTGIDDSNADLGPFGELNFSRKIVGWYDATADNALTPEDYGEHGTHVAGIAAGTGAANGLQGSGTIQTTFTYLLPPAGYGYMDYIDVMNPGVIQLSLQWSGPNTALLRLYDPSEVIVEQVIGEAPPLTIEYATESTPYPTGRYMVLVANYLGPPYSPFSCLETYPYEGRDDGYNLFSGVAPNSKLVGVKAFDNTGSGTLATLIEAMDWIIENRLTHRIVVASMSLSLENGATDTTLDQKVDTMVQNGIVTIASAGNNYPDYTIGSPGTAAYVITVAATNDQNGITSYSSNGDQAKNEYGLIKPDVSAPGGTFSSAYGNRIISADSNDVDGVYSGFLDQNADDYQQMGGTSMSAPHVAGLAALVVQAFGDWSWTFEEALKVKMLISMTAFETHGGEGSNVPALNRGEKDSKEGYGRVNADAVLEATTMNYGVGEEATDTFGSGSSDKKVWARQVYLATGDKYIFDLTVPVDADYDLFIYNGTPDSYGQPVILAKSVNASLGADEIVEFIPNASGIYYILAKQVSGEGSFTLSSTTSILRDVAVTEVEVSDTAVFVCETINITVTVQNYGDIAESFNVTVFYNSTVIEIKNISNLAAEASEVLTFHWDTSEVQHCGNYTIKAEASVVPGEVDIINNVYIDGTVKIELLGDINGDGVVDILDLSTVGLAFGSQPGDPLWNPDADITSDGIVNIFDLATVGRNYGKTC